MCDKKENSRENEVISNTKRLKTDLENFLSWCKNVDIIINFEKVSQFLIKIF